jgi:hypothetical protein
VPVGLFRASRRRREIDAAVTRPQPGVLPDDAFRRPATVAEELQANGDNTPFVVTEARLRHGGGIVRALLAASEIAVHIVEVGTGQSGVSSYNRIVRFDRLEPERVPGQSTVIGLCAYVGRRPVAEMIALGMGFAATELTFYVLEVPPTTDGDAVLEQAQAGFDLRGVPAHAHSVKRFLY